MRRLALIEGRLLDAYIRPGKLPGCSVSIVRRGELILRLNLGWSDIDRGKPVQDDTIWRIYSMSKPITAVALLALYEQGVVSLDDPVARFLPAWSDLRVAESAADGTTRLVEQERPMTIRHLLTHTSGLGYGPMNASFDRAALVRAGDTGSAPTIRFDASLEAMIRRLATEPLRFQPGSQWLYSFGLDVCGRVIEVATGLALDEYLRDQLFEPLRMTDTGFYVDEPRAGRLAASYGRTSDKQLRAIEASGSTSPYRSRPSFLSGGGGLVSTAQDYVRFCMMMLGGGVLDGVRVLSPATVSTMTRNQLPGDMTLGAIALADSGGEVTDMTTGFGLGVGVELCDRLRTPARAGTWMWGGSASTFFWVDPQSDLAVVFMTQLMPSGTFPLADQLRALVYAALTN